MGHMSVIRNKRIWVLARVALGLSVSVALGWLVIHGLNWNQVRDAFANMSLFMAFLALVLFFATLYLRAYRWKVILINERVSVARLFLVENEGLGINNLVPVRVAAEAIQWTVLTVKDRTNPSTTLATLGMLRVMDVIASSILLGIGFIFMPELKNFAMYIIGAMVFAVLMVIFVRFLSWSHRGLGLVQRFPLLASFTAAVATLERYPVRLGYALFLSFIYWMSVGLTTWVIAVGMNVPISPATATAVILGNLFFATAVPSAPGSIGTFEAAMVYVLGFFGIQKELAFGYAVMVHAVLFLPPSIIALLFLPGEGIGTLRQLRTLTGRFQKMTHRANS